jgi:hypothetical protein
VKKTKIIKPRLPQEAIDLLGRGGAHSSPKGKRGYDRNKEKENARRKNYDH